MVAVDADDLESFIERLVREMGSPRDIADGVANSLVTASLRGHNSHGVRRLPRYFEFIRDTPANMYWIDPTAVPSIESESATTAVIDGHSAFGQVVGRFATDTAIEMASETGVAAVGMRDATHLGRVGEYAERTADAGFMFAAFVNTQGGKLVAPPGSAQRRYATNPVVFGVPTFDALDFPIVLDIATSQIAGNKIPLAQSWGESLDEEWTVADDGGSVTDPERFTEGDQGALLPLGGRVSGYKGFGLAMIAELFAAIAGDGLVVPQGGDEFNGNAALFVAIDPTLFTGVAAIEERVAALAEYIESTEFSPEISPGGVAYGDRAYLPGEPEHLKMLEYDVHGIPLPDRDVEELLAIAGELDVEEAIPDAFDDI